jgi:hypothetical protein
MVWAASEDCMFDRSSVSQDWRVKRIERAIEIKELASFYRLFGF